MADEDDGEAIPLSDLVEELEPDKDEQPKAPAAQAKPAPVPGPRAAPAKPPPPQVGLSELERQIENERALRARAIADNQRLAGERDQAIAFAREAEKRGMSTYELFTENQINSVNEQMEALSAQAEGAMGDGDFKTASQLNLRLHKLGGQLAILERDKAALAEQRVTMTAQHQRPINQAPAAPVQQPVPTDPVERAVQGRTPTTQAFLRRHPELIRSDGSLEDVAVRAHHKAIGEGYVIDTPGYYAHIESLLKPSDNGGPPSLQRAPTFAAPVARTGGPSGSGGADSGTFLVTPKMRRLAEEQGVPIREWVDNYRSLLKQGRITEIR